MPNTETPQQVHEGRNLKRIREILKVKQTTLAQQLGNDWNQKKISQLEDKEIIDPAILEEVANALHVTPEAVKSFDEEAAINIISSTINNHDNSSVVGHYHFNPIDKIVELYESKVELYERMLKDKNDMIESLKEVLKNK